MTKFRLITAAFFLTAIFAVSAFAQAAPPAASGKIVFIDSGAFGDEKGGIPAFVTAINKVNNEFKPEDAKLQAMITRYQALGVEVQNLQKTPPAAVPAASADANLKVKNDQLEQMKLDIEHDQAAAKARYQSRYQDLVGAELQKIFKSLQDFAKQKNYSMILDGAKLSDAGIILAVGNDSADVTKDFITYYNSRPPGTATTAIPK